MTISRIELQKQGLELSRIAFGVWRFADSPINGNRQQISRLIDLCLDHGVTSFDHADIYGSYQCEELFGLATRPDQRQRMQVITKCGIKLPSAHRPLHRVHSYDTSAQHITLSVEQSLKNLRLETLDLLLLHRPDPLMDADEIAEAFTKLKRKGRVKAFGVSNFTPSQFDYLQSRLEDPLLTNQIELHPLHCNPIWDGTLNHAMTLRYHPMIWSPLAGGRIWTEQTAVAQNLCTLLETMAEAKNTQAETLLLAWLLKHPARLIPVLGTTNEVRLEKLLHAEAVQLDREQWLEILQAGMGQNLP